MEYYTFIKMNNLQLPNKNMDEPLRKIMLGEEVKTHYCDYTLCKAQKQVKLISCFCA